VAVVVVGVVLVVVVVLAPLAAPEQEAIKIRTRATEPLVT
jgi:hypothetical protein